MYLYLVLLQFLPLFLLQKGSALFSLQSLFLKLLPAVLQLTLSQTPGLLLLLQPLSFLCR